MAQTDAPEDKQKMNNRSKTHCRHKEKIRQNNFFKVQQLIIRQQNILTST